MRKQFSSMVYVVVAFSMIFALVATAFVGSAGSVAGALPAERLAAYDRQLAAMTRTAPYDVAPREDLLWKDAAVALAEGASKQDLQAAVEEARFEFDKWNQNKSRPNPLAYLGRTKQLEIAQRAGEAPSALSGTPQMLTVMMNFNGSQTFISGPGGDPVLHHDVCLTDLPAGNDVTVPGYQFNEQTLPADNWTAWLDPADSYTGGFTEAYWDKIMFSTEGYTQPIRTDMQNPWTGQMGFDYSGVSFHNFFVENSRGVYAPGGDVLSVQMPHPVSQWGAAACASGRIQDDTYFGPDWRIAISAAEMINDQYPSFDWTQWDQEDVYDRDNDGNFFEPDGYVDHFFLLEAGYGQGGEWDEFTVWPHSWDVNAGNSAFGPPGFQIGGYQVSTDGPMGGVWILNYTVSDEMGGLGVLVHEYGHDIGWPDNYSYGSQGSNVGFWDQMDSATFGGALSGMRPAHNSIWNKSQDYIGWNTPVEIDLATTTAIGEENAIEFMIGQQSKPPAGTVDGLRINLPPFAKVASVAPFGSMMFYSDQGDYRSESIAYQVTPAAGEDITVGTDIAYFIETDWDYMYWEVSTDDGANWTPLDVFSGTLELTTDTDPNGTNPTGNGITDFSGGWIYAHADIPAAMHGDAAFWFRFRYFTDTGYQEEGIYLDNISIDGSSSGSILFDDVEGADMWTHMSEGLNTTAPWYITNGIKFVPQSYMAEWRNSGEGTGFTGKNEKETFEIAGFDMGLNRLYWVDELDPTGDIASVDRFFQHTPGMVLWYVDGRYTSQDPSGPQYDDPSWGAKGRLRVVDANPYPYFVYDEGLGGNRAVTERRSSFDGAYTLNDRPEMTLSSNYYQVVTDSVVTIPGELAKPIFRDRVGVFPGIYYVPGVGNYWWDFDAGAVLPTEGNVPYWVAWDLYGDLGNPGLNAFGVNLEVVDQAEDGSWGKVKFWVDKDTTFVDHYVRPEGSKVGFTINLKDASGSRFSDTAYYLFDASFVQFLPEGLVLDESSVMLHGNGTLDITTAAKLRAEGMDVSAPDTATALVWNGYLGGSPLGLPDVQIMFDATYDIMAGVDWMAQLAANSSLVVQQAMVEDTFANGGAPFLWPAQPVYVQSPTVEFAPPTLFLPILSKP